MTSFVSSEEMVKEFLGGEAKEESPIKPVHTPCKDCVFAVRDVDGHQTDCSLGRIEKFRSHNPDNVLDVYDLNQNGSENRFTVINGRFCHAHRPRESAWTTRNAGREAEVVREEIALRMAVLVYMGDGLDLEGLKCTARALYEQERLPHQVFFLNHQKQVKPGDIQAALWEVLQNRVTWRVNRMMSNVTDKDHAVDVAVSALPDPRLDRSASTYYTVINSGYEPPKDFLSSIDRAMNDDLDRFRVLRPLPDGNAGVVQVWLHKKWSDGWQQVIPTMTALADEHGAPFLLKDVSEVCPSCV